MGNHGVPSLSIARRLLVERLTGEKARIGSEEFRKEFLLEFPDPPPPEFQLSPEAERILLEDFHDKLVIRRLYTRGRHLLLETDRVEPGEDVNRALQFAFRLYAALRR